MRLLRDGPPTMASPKSGYEVRTGAVRRMASNIEAFKEIAICLTPNPKGEHAYFPALIIGISFADLLSGLHAGKLKVKD